MESIQDELDLSVVPHFTTLQKFFGRIKTLLLRYAFRRTLYLFNCEGGLSDSNRSNGFIGVYPWIFESLLLSQNRQDLKTFPENFDLG
jgi:hypothetical protein